eukprot:GHRR01016740.1.p1 GENE.GHRR01016740.1~~GHRR01016740.1.p1  ORF type:complete len:218 (+),score=47.55 GHRR01016740.1:405-1058(+)
MSQVGKREDEPAYIAFRFFVKPELRKDFIDAWLMLEKDTMDEKDLVFYDLKSHGTDNVEFFGYGEWNCWRSFMKHFESDYVQNFRDFLADNDIILNMQALERPNVRELNPRKKQMTGDELAHVKVMYIVPPSSRKEFLDAWHESAKGVEGEKGAHTYSLRKVFGDNSQYFSYAAWDSIKDFEDHMRSDHVKDLHKTLDKEGIIWKLYPLRKIGNQPE